MLFSVSGVEVSPWVPPAVSFGISLFTSMGGVSGAFLILPFQVSILGFNSPAVSATNHLFNILAIPSGVYRYIREGRMVWPLMWAVIIGTLPGVLIGAVLRFQYLPNPRKFKIFGGLVLFYIGGKLLTEQLKQKNATERGDSAEDQFQKLVRKYRKSHNGSDRRRLPHVIVKKFNLKGIAYEFYGQTFDVHAMGVLALSFAVGIVGGVYGIGGGAIMAPFFVSYFGLPVYTVAGATLMGTFVTSIAGVCFYQLIAAFYPGMAIAPDWALGFLFGVGGFAGMYCGARLQKFVPAKLIKWMLVICILFTAIRYIGGFFNL